MKKLLITGGALRKNGPDLGAGKLYDCAKLTQLNLVTGNQEVKVLLDKTNQNYPDEYPSIMFLAASLKDGKLYVPTDTEVYIYNFPSYELLGVASYPSFNNIHHVAPYQDKVAVVSTGLDMVILLDQEYLEVHKLIHVLGEEPWEGRDPKIDYRKIHDTKPHPSHPNYVFELDHELWVTRCHQRDAVCLNDMSKEINVNRGGAFIHDGSVVGDFIYFTCVNGEVVVVNKHTLKEESRIDLNRLEDSDHPLGWCRGIAIDGNIAYVGFSAIRKTASKDSLIWMKKFMGVGWVPPTTRVAVYDLALKKKLNEFSLKKSRMDAIYSIILV